MVDQYIKVPNLPTTVTPGTADLVLIVHGGKVMITAVDLILALRRARVEDGDYGDVIVSSDGVVWQVVKTQALQDVLQVGPLPGAGDVNYIQLLNLNTQQPVFKWVPTASQLGLRFFSGGTEVLRLQDNGFVLAANLGTLGGLLVQDFLIRRATGGGKMEIGAGGEFMFRWNAQVLDGSYLGGYLFDSPHATLPVAVDRGAAGQTGDLHQYRDSADNVLSRTAAGGNLVTHVNAAPADATLANSEATYWFDDTPGSAAVNFKGKDSAGTVVTASIPLL